MVCNVTNQKEVKTRDTSDENAEANRCKLYRHLGGKQTDPHAKTQPPCRRKRKPLKCAKKLANR